MGCRDSFVQRVVAQRMFSTMIATAISDTSYPVRFGGGVVGSVGLGQSCVTWFGEGLSHLAQNDPEGVRQLESAGVEGR